MARVFWTNRVAKLMQNQLPTTTQMKTALLKTICRCCERVRERECSTSGSFVIAGDLLQPMSRSNGLRVEFIKQN